MNASFLLANVESTTAAPWYVPIAYLTAALLFVFSLRWLNKVKTARRGVLAGELGMVLAIVATLFLPQAANFGWVIVATLVGAAIGIPLAVLMPMTAVPQRTAFSHAFGALAAALVGTAKFYMPGAEHGRVTLSAIGFETLLGFLTFTGSIVAFCKLQELKFVDRFGNFLNKTFGTKVLSTMNLATLALAIVCGVLLVLWPGHSWLFPVLIVLSLIFGWMLVSPIGGADMPTVISLLNSYAGLSACAMGFVLGNPLLIVAGALDGSSGFILSIIMCKAMNRSFTNVLFGQIQASTAAKADDVYAGKVKSAGPDEIAEILADARRVCVVPGYGMAVAQAQFAVRDLYRELTHRDIDVTFAIHPVAGRMPGHMNVLLAEVDIDYEKLLEMEVANPQFETVDVAIVIGANDVVNPDARLNPNSPIAGMPILDVDKARTVVVIKRSLSPGFAGIPNPLFAADNTLMYFADGKQAVLDLVHAIEEASPLTPEQKAKKSAA
ncbi:MAG: NAD(P)(+) transhydrogenase (Re/Si-specific) subunit beta [Tepidisphaeraceae bacterium]